MSTAAAPLEFKALDKYTFSPEAIDRVEQLAEFKPRILLEHHLHIDPDCRAKCTAFLESLGYKSQGYRPHGAIAHEFFTCECE